MSNGGTVSLNVDDEKEIKTSAGQIFTKAMVTQPGNLLLLRSQKKKIEKNSTAMKKKHHFGIQQEADSTTQKEKIHMIPLLGLFHKQNNCVIEKT